jgi:predicted chitinase
MLKDGDLRVIMPALTTAKREACLPFLRQAMAEFRIESAPRIAAFLAQLAHESGQLRFMEEIWGPTPAQRRYEPVSTLATKLGNTASGDGKRFKGRGPIQITGRANYRRYGGLLGVDLESQPQLAARAELAFRIAGLYWSKNGLNELADEATAASFKTITRRINGGLNGLADRERFYAAACTALGVTPPSLEMRSRRSPGPRLRGTPFERGAEAIRRARQRPSATGRRQKRRTAR